MSWRRHLAPGFYFGWLQDAVMQRGQDRLLELLRRRIEHSPGDDAGPAVAVLPGPSRL